MAFQKPVNSNHGLQPGDGMSAKKSTEDQRGAVLEKLQDEASIDCIKYGFYMGEHMPGPIVDYSGDCVKREITLKNLK